MGKCYYKDDQGQENDVSKETLKVWWDSISTMIDWFESKSSNQ